MGLGSRRFILPLLNTKETAHIPQTRGGALVLMQACADASDVTAHIPQERGGVRSEHLTVVVDEG